MNVLDLLRARFADALAPLADDPGPLVDMVRPSQDPQFGDYQANCAMPLGKQLGRPPRDVAADVVGRLDVSDCCEPPEIAGPGFVNLKLRDDWLAVQLGRAAADAERLAVDPVATPRTFVIDYSSPNVAKPMHVGHIRSTVIGDALYRLLAFLGHRTISDNHIGDWGTQFGMIIYGFKNLADPAAYTSSPVATLGALYRLVRQLVDYHESRSTKLPALEEALSAQKASLEERTADAGTAPDKATAKALKKLRRDVAELSSQRDAMVAALAAFESNEQLLALALDHPDIGKAVLAETARLHEGDPENVALWQEFLPPCLEEIETTYGRLGVGFDHSLGESFYHDRLGPVVDDLVERGLARESDGAMCVFLEGHKVPMIVRKKDGAYLYATTDLATIRYRLETFRPDAILYVVDHRQALHFDQLFAVARKWGCESVELVHVSFGTVMGKDGRPFRTRSGDVEGLSSLLDEAVARALRIVSENDAAKPDGAELSESERRKVAEAIGIGALKYADLAHNRTSDYTFDYDKMLAMTGNTATYMQYAHARVLSIFTRGGVDPMALRATDEPLVPGAPAERALGVELLRFSEALAMAAAEYRPNLLTTYLFGLAEKYSQFYEACPVLKADNEADRTRRLRLCDLTARTLRRGLELLGIEVVERM